MKVRKPSCVQLDLVTLGEELEKSVPKGKATQCERRRERQRSTCLFILFGRADLMISPTAWHSLWPCWQGASGDYSPGSDLGRISKPCTLPPPASPLFPATPLLVWGPFSPGLSPSRPACSPVPSYQRVEAQSPLSVRTTTRHSSILCPSCPKKGTRPSSTWKSSRSKQMEGSREQPLHIRGSQRGRLCHLSQRNIRAVPAWMSVAYLMALFLVHLILRGRGWDSFFLFLSEISAYEIVFVGK